MPDNTSLLLYKYAPINQYLYDMLIQNALWFSNPSDFNDPFDCNSSMGSNLSQEDLLEFWKTYIVPMETQYFIDKKIEEWQTNPKDFEQGYIEAMTKLLDGIAISCFSFINTSLLMWSHYSNSHKGICIGFDHNILSETYSEILKVKYSQDFPQINVLRSTFKSLKEIRRVKSIEWSYEKEVRIFQKSKGAFPFNKKAIKDVIFGLRTPQEQMASIMLLMEGAGYKDVKFKKVVLNEKKFELQFVEVELSSASSDSAPSVIIRYN